MNREELEERFEDEKEDIKTRDIIKNSLLTLVTSVIILLIIIGLIQYQLIEDLYNVAFNFDSSVYYYEAISQLHALIQSILMGFISIALNLVIGIIRFVLLIIISIIILYTFIFSICNIILQTNIRFKYLILSSFITFILTVSISYFIMPTSVETLVKIFSIIELIMNNGIENLAVIFDLIRYLYFPIFLAMILAFVINTTSLLSIKFIIGKRIVK